MPIQNVNSKRKGEELGTGEKDVTRDNSEISTPLVFQCLKCKHVLGDSFRLLSSNQAAGTITLSGTTNTAREVKHATSTSGHDQGSTFVRLNCRHCKSVVGKTYVTTPRSLDAQRDVFTLSTDALSNYALGTHDDADEADEVPKLDGPLSSAIQSGLPNALRVASDAGSELWKEITQMQRVILALHERILHLEDLNHVELVGRPSQKPDGEAINRRLVPNGRARGLTESPAKRVRRVTRHVS